ncbi:hypothetical protein [Streptoalloteichus hindustanus]|uniref:Uncharacterized protein n=1 Tax=Streptoalloteichus hindustanus TaxID=2017 RepID=A0A1M5M766_STRHI|nr:hypothetical protein [Streptoalloteichus hindustanus]SHG73092.1 hypothetical protein SAMN05444320_11315 [Streptoalloteichus hindustanus]
MLVSELRSRIEDAVSSGEPFTLSAQDLGLDYAAEFFDTYLSGDLVVREPLDHDLAGLRLSGAAQLGEVGDLPRVDVVFVENADRVTGLRLAAPLTEWEIDTSYLRLSLDVFRDGFGFDGAVLVLAADVGAEGGRSWAAGGLAFTVRSHRACLVVRPPDEPGGVYELSGEFGPELGLPDLAALVDLPGLDALTPEELALPEEVPTGGALAGVSLRCGIDGTNGFRWMWVGVELSNVDWVLVPDLLRVDRLAVRFGVGWDEPGLGLPPARSVSAELVAALRVGGDTVTAHISVPDLVLTACLDNPDATDELVEDHLAESGIDVGVRVSRLAVAARLADRSYTVSLGLDTSWRFFEDLSVEGVSLELSGIGGAPDLVTITAGLAVADAVVCLEARREAGTGWLLAADTTAALEFAGFSDWLRDTLGTPLPAPLAGLTLDEVALAFDPTAQVATVTCACSLPVGEVLAPLAVHAQVSRVGEPASVSGVSCPCRPEGTTASSGGWTCGSRSTPTRPGQRSPRPGTPTRVCPRARC